MSVYFGDNFYIVGGFRGPPSSMSSIRVDSIERLNTKNWTWSSAGKFLTARTGHAAVIIEVRVIHLQISVTEDYHKTL